MIKYTAMVNGRKLLALGLSTRNLDKLKQNQPIHFNKEELGKAKIEFDDIIIYWGETEEQMIKELEPKLDKNTIIHKVPEDRKPH
jgi:hypothetical protein